MLEKGIKLPAKFCAVIFVSLQFLTLHFLLSALVYGAPRPQEQRRQALGSLTTVGEVHVNDAAAPSESTIFAGDVLRSSGVGSATFSLSGKGTFKIYPNTEVVFVGEPQYAAELKFGRVEMNSLNGATGINLRAGSSVVVALAEGEQSTSQIEAPSDGSFLVTCVGGSVGVIPLSGGKGIFIQAGQSVGISAQGELSSLGPQASPPTAPASQQAEPAARDKHGHLRWILMGAGVAGAGVAAAVLASRGSGTASVQSASVTPVSSPVVPVSSPPSEPQPAPGGTSPGASTGSPGTGGSGTGDSGPDNGGGNQGSSGSQNPPSCKKHKNCKPQVVIGFAFHF